MNAEEYRNRALAAAEMSIAATQLLVKENPDITVLAPQLQVMIHMVGLAAAIAQLPDEQLAIAVAGTKEGLEYLVELLAGDKVLQ